MGSLQTPQCHIPDHPTCVFHLRHDLLSVIANRLLDSERREEVYDSKIERVQRQIPSWADPSRREVSFYIRSQLDINSNAPSTESKRKDLRTWRVLPVVLVCISVRIELYGVGSIQVFVV